MLGANRGGATPTDSTRFLPLPDPLKVEMDQETGSNATSTTLALARSLNLTIFDGAYLEPAMRRKLLLATRDQNYREAAKTVSVRCVPEELGSNLWSSVPGGPRFGPGPVSRSPIVKVNRLADYYRAIPGAPWSKQIAWRHAVAWRFACLRERRTTIRAWTCSGAR